MKAQRLTISSPKFIFGLVTWFVVILVVISLTVVQMQTRQTLELTGLQKLSSQVCEASEITSLNPTLSIPILGPVTSTKRMVMRDINVANVLTTNSFILASGAGTEGSYVQSINRLGSMQWTPSSINRVTIVLNNAASPQSVQNGIVIFGETGQDIQTKQNAPTFDPATGAILVSQSDSVPMYTFRDAPTTGLRFVSETLTVLAPDIVSSRTEYTRNSNRSETFVRSMVISGPANVLHLVPVVTGSAFASISGSTILGCAHVELHISGVLQSTTSRTSMCVQTMWNAEVSSTSFSNFTLSRSNVAFSLVEPASQVSVVAGTATSTGSTRGVRVVLNTAITTVCRCTVHLRITYATPIGDPVLGLRLSPVYPV